LSCEVYRITGYRIFTGKPAGLFTLSQKGQLLRDSKIFENISIGAGKFAHFGIVVPICSICANEN